MIDLLGSYIKNDGDVGKIIATYNNSQGNCKQACFSSKIKKLNNNLILTQYNINHWTPEYYHGESFNIIPNIKDFIGKPVQWKSIGNSFIGNKTNIILPDETVIVGWFSPVIGDTFYLFEISNYVEIAEVSCDKQTAYVEIVK